MLKFWIMLYLAIAFEVSGTLCMKFSAGFTRLLPSVLVFVLYGVSFTFMSMAIQKIDVGVAYAIWSGVGIVSVALISCFLFGEVITLAKGVSLLIIIAGIVCLNLATDS